MPHEIQLEEIANKLNFSIENTQNILTIFYDSSEKLLNKIEESILNNDFDSIYRNAHSIKGSSSSLLFNDVYMIAKEVEENAKKALEYPYLDKVNEMRYLIKETKIV